MGHRKNYRKQPNITLIQSGDKLRHLVLVFDFSNNNKILQPLQSNTFLDEQVDLILNDSLNHHPQNHKSKWHDLNHL